jgi:hypothetical protein
MIRGYFEPFRFERPVARIEVDVSLPRVSPFPARIDFLIDTGATSSTIHPHDMLTHFSMTPNDLASVERWPRRKAGLGIGGRVLDSIESAELRFERDDGTVLALEQDVLIAQPTADNDRLPLLLSWDVLRHFRLTLDARTGLVLLDE